MALLLLAGVYGCEGELTEIVVVVDSELEVPTDLDEIVVTAEGASHQPRGASARLAGSGSVALPVTVGLRPGTNLSGAVTIHARGRSTGSERVAAHVSTHFVPGARIVLRLDLTADCLGILCEEAETCQRGRCVSDVVDPTTLPPYTGTIPDAVADAGPVDAGSVDAGPRDARVEDTGADLDASPACTANTQCDDSDACNGAERCEEGVCRPGTALVCDDGIACTVDACEADGCTHATNDALCTASAGGTCHAVTGCQYPTCTPATCVSDGCTNATCSGDMCVRTPSCLGSSICCAGACVAAGCDDGNSCTTDACGGSGCTHTARVGVACSDGNACTVGDSCNASGACAAGTPMNCDDGNPCTNDSCSAGACVHANNSVACDDGSACTTSDHCSGGSCGGSPRSCDDHNPCTTNGCNPSSGCLFPAMIGSCDDGNPCTTGESCTGGVCGGGLAPVCPPATEECHRAVCAPGIGCTTEPTDGIRCNDGDNCTTNDRCDTGMCVGLEVPDCVPY